MRKTLPLFTRVNRLLLGLGMGLALLATVSCSSSDDDAADTYAVVQAASFNFNETDPSVNVIQVLANTAWQVFWTPASDGVTVEPAAGSGNGSFRVTAMPAGQTLRFGVRTADGRSIDQYVTVTRAAESGGEDDEEDGDEGEGQLPIGETLFSLDFGNGEGGVWADTNNEWKTQTGSGAATVSYNMYRMRINNDNFGSANRYTGASGHSYAKIFTDGDPGYFTIRDISLPEGQTAFWLSFGAIFPEGDMRLEVSADGAT